MIDPLFLVRCTDRNRLRAIAAGGGPRSDNDYLALYCPACGCSKSGDRSEPNRVDEPCEDASCLCHDEQAGAQATCAVCGVAITGKVEPHWRGWLDADGGQLSYSPTLHDHVPAEPCAQCHQAPGTHLVQWPNIAPDEYWCEPCWEAEQA